MSRALRRHPAAGKSGRKQRAQARALPRPGTARRPQRETGEGRGVASLFQPRWATDIISELQKVTWPSREDTWYLTLVVLIVTIAFGIFLGGVDMFFNWAIDNSLLR